ncbi:hypothetical protein Ciccas_005623 [Cichlidogyrus casuarinus]|uniref:Uncharacterized protein n=1 Tax=Cichlidogyrus casuarinus TaxID=1844966 RepID=A0ABD2Q856_9PLAT
MRFALSMLQSCADLMTRKRIHFISTKINSSFAKFLNIDEESVEMLMCSHRRVWPTELQASVMKEMDISSQDIVYHAIVYQIEVVDWEKSKSFMNVLGQIMSKNLEVNSVISNTPQEACLTLQKLKEPSLIERLKEKSKVVGQPVVAHLLVVLKASDPTPQRDMGMESFMKLQALMDSLSDMKFKDPALKHMSNRHKTIDGM